MQFYDRYTLQQRHRLPDANHQAIDEYAVVGNIPGHELSDRHLNRHGHAPAEIDFEETDDNYFALIYTDRYRISDIHVSVKDSMLLVQCGDHQGFWNNYHDKNHNLIASPSIGFLLPADADTTALKVTQSNDTIRIEIGKRLAGQHQD
ncbi:MAG: Hsp20/alpha crystallin family protein [Gammaproteobacteria bacterium]